MCLNLYWPCAIYLRNSARNSNSARKHDVKRLLHHSVGQVHWYENSSTGWGERRVGFEDLGERIVFWNRWRRGLVNFKVFIAWKTQPRGRRKHSASDVDNILNINWCLWDVHVLSDSEGYLDSASLIQSIEIPLIFAHGVVKVFKAKSDF